MQPKPVSRRSKHRISGCPARAATVPHPAWRGLLLLLVLLSGATTWGTPVVVAGMGAQPASSTAPECVASQPDDGRYQVTLCLDAPAGGSRLSGHVPVAATLRVTGEPSPLLDYLQFFLTGTGAAGRAALLRDYAEPFTFTLPTERWTDGDYRLAVVAQFADGFTSAETGLTVSLGNGVTRLPISTGGWEPAQVTGAPGQSIMVAAVGDGASGLPASYAVAELIEAWAPDLFLYLGDVYNSGTYTEFLNHYDPTYGRFKAITNPVPGDHEGGRQFQGYFDYWNSSQHYYTAAAGSWRLIALNTTARYGQVAPGSLQFEWLKSELAADDDAGCTLVFTHMPRWTISSPEDKQYLDALWSLLVQEGVDLVLAGHEHRYERWQPLDASGVAGSGPVEFVVGTGGSEWNRSRRTDPRVEAAFTGDGALRLELREGAAEFQFVSTAGGIIDSGTIPCRPGAPAETAGAPVVRDCGQALCSSGITARVPPVAAMHARSRSLAHRADRWHGAAGRSVLSGGPARFLAAIGRAPPSRGRVSAGARGRGRRWRRRSRWRWRSTPEP
jgi:hypothetical protein